MLKTGDRAKILKINSEDRVILTGIGILEGDEVIIVRRSFLGSPIVISSGESYFALRVNRAQGITVLCL